MRSLLLKNILIQKKTLLFALVYSVAIFFLFQHNPFKDLQYIMGGTAIAYLLLMGANGIDEKNNTEIIFNSLPVKREVIVLSNYLSGIMFLFIGLVMTGIAGAILKMTGAFNVSIRFINWIDICVTFLNLTVMVSLYYPLYFKFSYKIVRVANLALFMVMFFIPGFIVEYIQSHPKPQNFNLIVSLLTGISPWSVVSLALIAAVCLALLSLMISIKIYEKKEF